MNTLTKRRCAKSRVLDFLNREKHVADIAIESVNHTFIVEFVKQEQVLHKNSHNTIWKYFQMLKEILKRAVTVREWIPKNPFEKFLWNYSEPEEKEWPTMDEMKDLIAFDLENEELATVRDVFVYQSFAGPPYSELFTKGQALKGRKRENLGESKPQKDKL